MTNWMRRFGILTVLGALICGALVAGCGGGDTDEGTEANNTANTATAPADDTE